MKEEIVAYLHCKLCLDQSKGESIKHEMSVGVSNAGALVISCTKHNEIIAKFDNHNIAEELFAISTSSCCECGDCKTKEICH